MSKCNIIMYHFVRELQFTRYPKIKARLLSEFENQIDYLSKDYNFVTVNDIIDDAYNKKSLPDNSVLLTFDDGYIDHYKNVFPILDEKEIQGCFYPPSKAILENKVLDVNKIHFILAVNEKSNSIENLKNEIFDLINSYKTKFNLKSCEYYYSKLAKKSRFDTEEVIFIKRLLQRELSEEVRDLFLNILFERHVGVNEKAFSNELYMSIDQLKCMSRNGMHIGSHGYKHYWLNSLDRTKIKNEVEKSIDFLKEIGTNKEQWSFCYPYGAYNKNVLDILKEKGYKIGFTTEAKASIISSDNLLTLSRLDTNDIPITK